MVVVALWEFGICATQSWHNMSKWEQLKGVLAKSTCHAVVAFYDWVSRTARFRMHRGRDYAFLMDKVWYKRDLVPAAILENSMLIGVEDRRDPRSVGDSEAVLVPYYLEPQRWALEELPVTPQTHKFLLVAWIGTLYVENHCDRCPLDVDPAALRRRTIESLDCEGAHVDCLVVSLERRRRNDHEYLEKATNMPHVLKSSSFCPVPRGDSAATRRFYSAIFALCVPVLISDHFPFPFHDMVNYDDFVVRLNERDVVSGKHQHLAAALTANFSAGKLLAMQQAMFQARDHFSFDHHHGKAIFNLLRDLYTRHRRRFPPG